MSIAVLTHLLQYMYHMQIKTTYFHKRASPKNNYKYTKEINMLLADDFLCHFYIFFFYIFSIKLKKKNDEFS